MKIQVIKYKTKYKTSIANGLFLIFLMLAMTVSPLAVLSVNAHTPQWKIPTYAFINAAPDPCGVGQTLTLNFWLQMPPATASILDYGDRYDNMTVKVTLPDQTTTTIGPFSSDTVGGAYALYYPTIVGNYTFQMSYPGQTIEGKNPPPGGWGGMAQVIGDIYLPSISNIAKVAVQEEPITSIPFNQFPTNYWTRPINAENNNWYSLGGNWLGLGLNNMYNESTNYNPWSEAPHTAHVLWTKPVAFGGQIGGEFGDSLTSNFYPNRQYEVMLKPVIMSGVLYYTLYPTGGDYANFNEAHSGIVAVDLKTGETKFTIKEPLTATGANTVLRCGQLLNLVSPNQYGVSAYLWTRGLPIGVNSSGTPLQTGYALQGDGRTTYNMFDAFDGSYILSIVNGSGMTLVNDDGGNLIGYYVNSSTANVYHAPTLNMWNSTWCIMNYNNQTGKNIASMYTNMWMWRPIQGAQIPFSMGIEWSKPLATNYSGNALPTTLTIMAINSGAIVMRATSASSYGGSSANAAGGFYQIGWQIEAGYNADTGAQLWITNRTQLPFTRYGGGITGAETPCSNFAGCGIYVELNMQTLEAIGYDLYTGKQVWTKILPDARVYDTLHLSGFVADDILYIYCLGGDVYALDMKTGVVQWHYALGSSGIDSPYGNWPIWSHGASESMADGLLFVMTGHEYSPPQFRGARIYALNATNGQPVWDMLGFMVATSSAIADGVLISPVNGYDNQIYAFAKGPSKVTVTTPNPVTSVGRSIVITGTVTDISAGSQQDAVAMNFPNGLPAVSDASMTQWMEYVYEQQPRPTNVTGVPVSINVIDSNGNYRNIGTTKSDGSGTFAFTWTPDIDGDFTVIANFAGTQSYYPSNAEAHFTATASEATPAPTQEPVQSMADKYLLPSVIAILVAIAIIGAVLALLVTKKRP